MRYIKLHHLFAFIFLFSYTASNAQLLKKLKEAVKKEVNTTVEEISKKKNEKKNEEKGKPEKQNKSNKSDQSQKRKPSIDEGNTEIKKPSKSLKSTELKGIVFESPNTNFQSFALHEFKGLPRFGDLNVNGGGAKARIYNVPRGYRLYRDMLISKYSKEIDRNFLGNIISKELWFEYFCNKQNKNCTDKKYAYGLSLYSLNAVWGGSQFEAKRKKEDFNKRHLPTLVGWRNSFMVNDFQKGYRVIFAHLGEYDFENAGYWIRISGVIKNDAFPNTIINGYNSDAKLRASFVPKSRYEKEIDGIWVLLEVNEEKAEELANDQINGLYFVTKINLSFYKTRDIHYMGGGRKSC